MYRNRLGLQGEFHVFLRRAELSGFSEGFTLNMALGLSFMRGWIRHDRLFSKWERGVDEHRCMY